MRHIALAALMATCMASESRAEVYPQPGGGTPRYNNSGSSPQQGSPTLKYKGTEPIPQSGASTPARGNLAGTNQGDNTSCCGAASVTQVLPQIPGVSPGTASGSSSGTQYSCLPSYNSMPQTSGTSHGSSYSCEYKSDWKNRYCACSTYTYRDVHLFTSPGSKQDYEEPAPGAQCIGYSYAQTYNCDFEGRNCGYNTVAYCPYGGSI